MIDDVPRPPPVLEPALVKRMAVGLAVLLAAAALVGVVAREPLRAAGAWAVDAFGAWGLAVGIVITDVVPFPPLTHEPLLALAWLGGFSFVEVWAIAGAASWGAGALGYWLGRLVGARPFVVKQLERAGVAALMQRRGPTVVAIAALTPIPFAPTTWASGALRLPFVPVFAACAVRVVKVGLYLGLLVLGLGA